MNDDKNWEDIKSAHVIKAQLIKQGMNELNASNLVSFIDNQNSTIFHQRYELTKEQQKSEDLENKITDLQMAGVLRLGQLEKQLEEIGEICEGIKCMKQITEIQKIVEKNNSGDGAV